MKKVKRKSLFISYLFPPAGGGGVFRTLKFCKFLPLFGWQPHVLTVREHDSDSFDPELLSQIPEVPIHKTHAMDLPLIYKKYLGGGGYRSLQKKENNNIRLVHGIKKFVDNFVIIPDSRIGWIPFAVYEGFRICRKEGIDLLYSTGGPWTNHLIGLLLKRITRLPWVADFRDSWTESPYFGYPSRIRKRIEERMERWVIMNCDSIVSATRSIANELKEKYLEVNPGKIVTIMNGVDSDDFSQVETREMNGFNITHTGNFYSTRTPRYFLQALKKLVNTEKILESNFKVNFVGDIDERSEDIICSSGLANIIQCVGIVTHKESIKWMCGSDLLLLIVGDEKSEVTSKVFEYMMTKRPILALSGQGEVSFLLEKTGMATIVDPTNVSEIKEAIHSLYLKSQTGQMELDLELAFIKQFERKELTRQLSKIFDKCI